MSITRDVVVIQRGEEWVRHLVRRQSTDGGVTWTRQSLAGCHFGCDIRRSRGESSALMLRVRDNDANAYATLEAEAVQLSGETAPSTVGVIAIRVPVAAVLAALPAGTHHHDLALVDSGGKPKYQTAGPVIVEPRSTVLEGA
jgi:hypothetical protein